ncbi:MAG TPA: TSUP family transporter [Gaiellales bacterium]|nr:TSUP family transporter [Gaiellales bacterium]
MEVGVLATVLVLAVVQSVFGVGLLVFGTPTLLLMGYPFDQVLAYLLPCSIVVSALQVRAGGGLRLDPLRRRFLLLTAPTVLVGTVTVLLVIGKVDVKPFVGAMLVATALLRLGGARERLYAFVRRRLDPLLLGLGVLHGLTNLGGGVLTVIVSSVEEDKHRTRAQIAFCYGLMGAIQVTVVAATSSVHWTPLLPLAATAAYAMVGRHAFAALRGPAYQHGLTGLIAAYGAALILTA